MTRPQELLLKGTHEVILGEGTVRIHVHHVGKGLHSLKDNKVQGEGGMERDEEGLRGFIWELWKDPGEEQKRTDSNLHYSWGCGWGWSP